MDSYVRYEYAQLNRTNVTSPAEGLGPGNSELVNEIDVMNIAFNDTVTDGDFAVEVDDEGITAFITFTLRNATYWIVGDWSNVVLKLMLFQPYIRKQIVLFISC
jgi:hypothetical protein